MEGLANKSARLKVSERDTGVGFPIPGCFRPIDRDVLCWTRGYIGCELYTQRRQQRHFNRRLQTPSNFSLHRLFPFWYQCQTCSLPYNESTGDRQAFHRTRGRIAGQLDVLI